MKKGRYTTVLGNRGKCPGSYVREEVLEAEFAKAIRQLAFTDEFLEQAKEALRQSQAVQRQEHEETIARLQAEKTKLQRRIDASCSGLWSRSASGNAGRCRTVISSRLLAWPILPQPCCDRRRDPCS
jgi:hypothetical protein